MTVWRRTVKVAPAPAGEPQGIYLPYRPSRLLIADAREHPSALVESQAMGSIAAPPVAYEPVLPARILDDGLLSDAQLETLIYAGAAFERDLPGRFISSDEGLSLSPAEAGNAYRTGFFLGDGTGAGKGRQVAFEAEVPRLLPLAGVSQVCFADDWLRDPV